MNGTEIKGLINGKAGCDDAKRTEIYIYYNYNEKQTHTGCVCNPLIYMIYTNINVPKI